MESRFHQGLRVEEEAARALARQGLRLVERNVRYQRGEIDLVMEERLPSGQVELVLVEVRSRATSWWGSGLEAIEASKRERLIRAGEMYLARYCGPASSVRFDLVVRQGDRWTHYRNAWTA